MATANEGTTYARVEYNSAPSLQHLATVRIGITLWEEKVITNAIQEFLNFAPQDVTSSMMWVKVEKLVTHRIPLLGLPERLANAVACVLRPIGLQIMNWLDGEILRNYRLAMKEDISLEKICWTPRGTIDKKRTSKLLINDTNLHFFSRFEMACLYCHDEIVVLWSEMPTELKKKIRDNNGCHLDQHDLVSFWANVMDGNRLEWFQLSIELNFGRFWSQCLNDVTFQWMSTTNYIETVKYLWELLTESQRSSVLDWMSNNFNSLKAETVVFCLSKMTDYQQRQALMSSATLILRHLAFDWVLRDFFLPTLEQVWSVIDGKDFIQLLALFCRELYEPIDVNKLFEYDSDDYCDMEPHGCKNLRHQIVFRQIWCRSPLNLRKHVFDDGLCQGSLLWQLLRWEDLDNLALVLSSGSDEDRREVINCGTGKYFIMKLVSNGRQCLLKELLMRVFLSVDEVTKFMRNLHHRRLEEDVYFLRGCTHGHQQFHTGLEIPDYMRSFRDSDKVNDELLALNDLEMASTSKSVLNSD